MDCLFSIIIPTYNRATFLPMAIESVLAQTYTDWELIIVDDGSTDNTKDVVFQYQDKRIRYIYQHNAERSVARNNGIANATGEYVCFLDSDDSYQKDYLKSLNEIILQKCNGEQFFIISGMSITRNDHKETVMPMNLAGKPYHYFYKNSIPPSIVCVSRALLQKHQFDKRIVVSEDTKLWVEMMQENPTIICNRHIGINFLFHSENTINIRKRNVYKERQQTLQLILTEDTERHIDRFFAKKVIDDCNFGIAQYYINKKRNFNAVLVLLKSIVLFPSNRLREKLGSIRKIITSNTL